MVGIEFLNNYLKKPELVDYEVAGGPSFDIGAGGDARRSRKGLSVEDVQRLIQAYPQDADKIRKMYLPGPQAPGFLMRGV